MDSHLILGGIFSAVIIAFLVLDLGYFNRQAHKVSAKSAIIQSLFWLGISLAYAVCVYFLLGQVTAIEFTSAYVTEKMLSVDNLFVILLIFRFFNLDEKLYHRVLFWGILGAIVFRGIFIGLGSVVISEFHWVLYVFGAVLVYTGFKLFADKKDEEMNIEDGRVFKLARKYLPLTTDDHGSKFSVREGGRFKFTMLFVILLIVETTDIIFAFDSIPAVFSITQDPFIVFTSNVFAVMGLRALFFLVENILTKFHYLQRGLSFILVFIGGKMLVGIFDFHISSIVSFGVIIGVLLLSALASVAFPKKYESA